MFLFGQIAKGNRALNLPKKSSSKGGLPTFRIKNPVQEIAGNALELHYKLTKGYYSTDSNGFISNINDLSGKGRHAYTKAGMAPYVKTNGIDGKDVINFGTNSERNYLISENVTFGNIPYPFTVFVVGKVNYVLGGNNALVYGVNSGSNATFVGMIIGTSLRQVSFKNNVVVGSSYVYSGLGNDAGEDNVYKYRLFTNVHAANSMDNYGMHNGVYRAPDTTPVNTTTVVPFNSLIMGTIPDFSVFMYGEIAEFIIVSGALNVSNPTMLAQMNSYLLAQYPSIV
jgi:hypothetical protein